MSEWAALSGGWLPLSIKRQRGSPNPVFYFIFKCTPRNALFPKAITDFKAETCHFFLWGGRL